MGIYDRDYYRAETRHLFGASRTRVCTALIIINIVAFIIQLATRERVFLPFQGEIFAPGWFTSALWLDVDAVLHGEVWRLLTYAFLHSTQDIFHIVFNMLFLWWFGSKIEDIYGSREFLAFYLTAAVLAGLGYLGVALVEGREHAVVLGASGAVTAVMVLFATHYPHHTILLFFVLPVPVWALVVFQVIQDTFGLLGGSSRPIAFAAHLTGAAFGFLYKYYDWRVLNWLPRFPAGARGQRRKGRLRAYREDPEPVTAPAPSAGGALPGSGAGNRPDEHLEAKLDEVLAKLAQHGQDSLSESERELLFRASEVYKRRRKDPS
ncbi:MAG TPA: rhomboid family intramembrane serine protease [Gemmataceae bacterium]